MQCKLSIWVLATILLSYPKVVISAEILDYYPSCHYQILDTISMKQSLLKRRTASESDSIDLSVRSLLERIIEAASEEGASGVILTAKSVKMGAEIDDITLTKASSAKLGYVSFDAELISACEGEYTFSPKSTPVNKSGIRQTGITIKLPQSALRIALPPINLNRAFLKQPELIVEDISLAHGVFGIKVGMTPKSVGEVLGSPTSEFQISYGSKVQSYGRNLWVVFENNVVTHITNKNHWLSGELVNLLEFDNRFPARWHVENSVIAGMTAEALLNTKTGRFVNEDTYRISGNDKVNIDLKLTTFIAGNSSEMRVESYTYGDVEVDSRIAQDRFNRYEEGLYQRIFNRLLNQSSPDHQIGENVIGSLPILRARDNNGRTVRVYDFSLALVFESDHLTEIIVSEALFKGQGNQIKWHFGPLFLNQPAQELREVFGNDIYERDFDHWEVYSGNFKYDLYFTETDGELVLTSFLLDVF